MIKNKVIFGIILLLMLFSLTAIVSGTGTVPVLSNPYPTDTLTNVDILQSTVNVTVYDLEETFNWTIEGLYVTNTGADGASNGSKSANLITPLPFNTVITWIVNTTDGTNFTNATYTFTTRAEGRLTEHMTDASHILLVGIVSLLLFLGLIVYALKMIKEKSFKTETFINLLVAVIVIVIVVSFI